MHQPTEDDYDRQGVACIAWLLCGLGLLALFTLALLIKEICR